MEVEEGRILPPTGVIVVRAFLTSAISPSLFYLTFPDSLTST